MAATEIAFFTERLALKEQELGEIKSEFHKYKLKQKVKYDNLRKEIASFGNPGDAKENAALLAIRVAELETELEEARSHSEGLYGELAKRQTQLDDHMILIKNFENQLKELTPVEKIDKKSQLVDVESVKQQMMLKDQRILELINEVIEKSQKISELQEMYREKEEVAESKTKAMRIVQKKFEEIESRERREVGTETDPWPTMRQKERETPRGASRSLSPGHAVVSRGTGGHSPPPLDPQDGDLDDDILPGPSGFYGKNLDEEVTLRRKQRKRVTFDLPPSASTSMMNLTSDAVVYDQLVENISRLSEENARLMADLEKTNMALSLKETQLEENKIETEKLLRDTDILSVKARAAHRRIKDYEMNLEMKEREHKVELGRLKVEIDTLRSTREWEVEQNARLRDQLDQLREKNLKLTEELTSNGEVNRNLESKLEKAQSLLENITTDLEEAETLVVFMEDEKQSILDDVEKMKEAILAQDQFISLLEADIVIYEEHVGLLRDSLGASKVDHRSLLRSKAFETKLRALEQEKEQITIKSREEKQRTKALAEKVKTLEEENERLMRKECDREMQAAEEAEMAETCRQLEARLRETDERMRLERTQFEMELEASRVENKQRNRELEELNFQLNVLRRQEENLQQTVAVQETSETQELRGKVESQETKIRELSGQISSLERELDNVRGLNFELQGQLKETEELEKDYDELVEKHRQACMDLVASKEKIQQLEEVTATIPELEEAKKYAEEQVEQLERDKRVMRVEVEAARTTFTETAAVKKELEYLQAELEREKVIGQQKWEEFCKKALEGGISEPGSRKSSMEIQREQYIIAFEEKIEKLEEELLLTKTQLASEEQQKHELQRKIEEKEEVVNVQSAAEEKNHVSEEIQKEMEEMKQREDVLRNKIRDLELENSLAAELGVEMGRVIQTYEHQIKSQEQMVTEANERSHSATMELRLHEMLTEELGAELDQLRIAHTDIEEKLQLATNDLQEKEEALGAVESKNSALEEEISSLKRITEMSQTEPSAPPQQEEVVVQTTVQPVNSAPEQPASDMQRENEILRQCVNETIQLREDMTQDVEKLLELKNELETAVGALQGEIWTLNGQLKASVLDREQLQDRVVQLDTSLTEEKKKVASLDVELSEQVELTEKATRQAAEAENESNRRLDECREMESRRGELEQAYAQLTEYYNQLQAAYNQLYANVHRTNDGTQQTIPQMAPQPMDPALLSVIDGIMADLQLESSPEMDIRSKMNAIQMKIRERMQELEQLHSAVNEQRKVNEALEGRMGALEERAELTGGESLELKNRLSQLEGDLEWKQEECDSLRRQVDELQHALNTVIANDGDDALATSRLRTELAILAAKLATRQADVDSLFRTNAELAHSNVRLQNELEEREESEESSGNHQDQRVLVEKVKELEEKLAEWINSKEEIDRLRGIEKVLNNRILSLEDQLLEKEEQLQAVEEELLEQRAAENSDELHKLQEANSIVIEELTSLREERDTLRRTIETMEKERENRKEEAVNQKKDNEESELKEEIERLKKERQEEKRMAKEELKQYQDELEEMQTELQVLQEKLKMKEQDQKKDSEWGDWGEEEKEGPNEEIERLTANIEELEISLEKERDSHQRKMKEILKEKEETEKALREKVDDAMAEAVKLKEEVVKSEKGNKETEKQEEWGWGEEEGHEKEYEDGEKKDLQEEISTLRETIDELRQKLEDSEKSEGQFRSQVAELEVQMASGQQSRESWNEGWGEEGAEEIEDLRQSEAELKNQLELAQQQLNVASVELEERKREMEELNGELENYKENEQRFESMAAARNGETEKLKELISRLEEEKEELSQETEDLRREMQGFLEREQSLQRQMETLNTRLEVIEKEKEVSEKKDEGWDDDGWGDDSGTSKKEESEVLKRELEEAKEQLAEAHRQISSLKTEIDHQTATVARLESEVETLEEREISLKEELEKKETIAEEKWDDGWGDDNESKEPSAELLELQKELADTQKELQETKEKLISEQNDVKKMKEQVEELEKDVEDRVVTDARLVESLAKMEKEKENLLSIVTRTEQEKDEILTEIEDLKLVIIEYSEKEKTLEKRLNATISQLTEAQEECQRLREENQRNEEEVKTKSAEDAWGNDGWDEEEEQKELQEELEKSQEQLSKVSQKLEEVEKILKETKKTALERENELQRKIDEFEEKSKEAEEAEKLRKTLKEKESEMERIGKKLEEVMKQNNLLKESEGRLLDSVDEWGEIAEKNGEESKRLQKVVNDLEKERVGMEEELARLRREIEILREKKPEKQESTFLTNELETLREERNSLRTQLTTVEAKLAEVEKEKAAVKSSYDQLRAKITARRAAAAGGPRSRPPSVASSIGEIREEPILPPSSPTPITPLSVSSQPQQAQLSAQAFDGKVRDFVDDVKEFADRVYSFTNLRLEDIVALEQSVENLEMGKRGKKAAKKTSTPELISQSIDHLSAVSPLQEENSVSPDVVTELHQFDPNSFIQLAQLLQEHDAERFKDLQEQITMWSSLFSSKLDQPDCHHVLSTLFPSMHVVLQQVHDVFMAQKTRHETVIQQLEQEWKTELDNYQASSELNLKQVSAQLESVTQKLAEDLRLAQVMVQDERHKQEELAKKVEEQTRIMEENEDAAAATKQELDQAKTELDAAKKRVADVMEQGDELYHKLFEMHRENEEIDVLRRELETMKIRELEVEQKFEELHAVYGTMKDAFGEELKRKTQLVDEVEKQRRYTKEVETMWQQKLSEKEDLVSDMKVQLEELTEEVARKDHQMSEQSLEMDRLRADSSREIENFQQQSPSHLLEEMKERNNRLESALDTRNREVHRLRARVEELNQEVGVNSEELQKARSDKQRIVEELNDARFQLEQSLESHHDNFGAAGKLRDMERTIATMEADNYEKIAQITMQLQEYEERLLTASEKEKDLLKEKDFLESETSQWKMRCETLSGEIEALNRQLEETIQKNNTSAFLTENAELRSQLAAITERQTASEVQIEQNCCDNKEASVYNDDFKNQLVDLESRLAEVTKERDVLLGAETRISIEPESSPLHHEDANQIESACPSNSSLLLPSNFDDVVEKVRNSRLVRAGAPLTSPLTRKLRAILGRRAIRPYLRYIIAGYFFFLHFLLFNCWLH